MLPGHQGSGHGRALVETFCRAAPDAGAPASYDRRGLTPIEVHDGGTYLGRATSAREP